MSDVFSLDGKIALVTGSNTGIGQAIAVSMATAGAEVICANRSNADETIEMITQAGGKATSLQLDLSNPMKAAAIVESIPELDILVNNAGIIRRADAVDFTEADWDDVMDVNIKAMFFICQAFGRNILKRSATGSIINIASMLSFQGGIRVASYTASKSGVPGLTKLLANEWAAKGINTNAIAPGYIATNNTKALQNDPIRNKAILDRIPAARWGEAADIGGAAVFLASKAAQYINGATLNVDGGWLAR